MPIDLTRCNVEGKLSRLTYPKGLNIKSDVQDFLKNNPSYAFSADELCARIDTAASAVMIESVLSHHPEMFSYGEKNGKIYWFIDPSDSEST